jgi:hypothetical protein
MKLLSSGLFALGLLTAPFVAFGDVQITSFEGAVDPAIIDPWVPGPGTNSVGAEVLYQITSTAATHGTSSLEVVYPMDGTTGVWSQLVSVPTETYASTVAQGTGIQADVYFEWPDRPANTTGGPWYGIRMILNSTQTGWVEINPASGGIAEGQWRTLFFPMTADQVTKLTTTGQTSSFGFHFGGGTWGGAPMGGNIKLRFDNIIVVGASASGPAAPTDLTGTAVLGGANLTWTASPNALTYTLKRRASLSDAYTTVAADLTTTSYSDSGLEGNTTYYYVVTASNADGESSFSAVASVTTPNDDVLLTSFESGLAPWTEGAATANGGGTITYAINAASASEGTSSAEASIPMLDGQYMTFYSAGVSNYRTTIAQSTGIKADVYVDWIDRPAGSGTGGTWFNIQLNRNYPGSFSDTPPTSGSAAVGEWRTLTWNLTPEQIAALTANSNNFGSIGFTMQAGTWGEGVTMAGTFVVRIDNVRVKGFREVAVPAAPTGLVATGGAGQIGLAWNASATALGYTIQRSLVAGGPYSTVANVGNVTSHTDTGLDGATTYYYVVVPVNAGGNGPASAEASATTDTVVLTGIASWRQTHFGSSEATGNAANDADPDADGVANLLEYALAGDPMVAENDLLPVTSVEAGHLTLSFDRISDGTLTYEVLAADDLATWSSIWSSTGAENTAGLVTVTDSELLSAHPRRFLRLRVTTP